MSGYSNAELIYLLEDLLINVDEDCPMGDRTWQLKEIMEEAQSVIEEYRGLTNGKTVV